MSTTLITLLIIYQVKHFLADYPLQTPYMLGKFKPGWDWVNPLITHCWVHGIFSFIIAFGFTRDLNFAVNMYCLDFFPHFIMDRIKASPNMLGRFTALGKKDFHQIMDSSFSPTVREVMLKSNKLFWWSLGLDQMVHHLTHYAIIYFIMERLK